MPELPESQHEWPLLSQGLITQEEARRQFELIGSGELVLPVVQFENLDSIPVMLSYGDEAPDMPSVEPPEEVEDPDYPLKWGNDPSTYTNEGPRFTREIEVDGILSVWGNRYTGIDSKGNPRWETRGTECPRNMFNVLEDDCGGDEHCGTCHQWPPWKWENWRNDTAYTLNFYDTYWDPTLTF